MADRKLRKLSNDPLQIAALLYICEAAEGRISSDNPDAELLRDVVQTSRRLIMKEVEDPDTFITLDDLETLHGKSKKVYDLLSRKAAGGEDYTVYIGVYRASSITTHDAEETYRIASWIGPRKSWGIFWGSLLPDYDGAEDY